MGACLPASGIDGFDAVLALRENPLHLESWLRNLGCHWIVANLQTLLCVLWLFSSLHVKLTKLKSLQ